MRVHGPFVTHPHGDAEFDEGNPFLVERPGMPGGFAVALMACEGTLRIDKARREMGYAPVLTREEGLEHLAAQATKG